MIAGTFSRAANLLNISQPAISNLINDLEHIVGFKLFLRTKSGVEPTPEAGEMMLEVEKSFVGLSQIESAATTIGQLKRGSIRIVTMPLAQGSVFAEAVRRFCDACPGIEVILEVQSRMRVLDLIAGRNFDLGVATAPVYDKSITFRTIAAAQSVCLLPKSHRLAAKAKICVTDLDGVDFIAQPPDTDFSLQLAEMFGAAGVKVRSRVYARTDESIFNLVAAGIGVSVVSIFDMPSRLTDVVVVRPFEPPTRREIGIIQQRHAIPSRQSEIMKSMIIDLFRN